MKMVRVIGLPLAPRLRPFSAPMLVFCRRARNVNGFALLSRGQRQGEEPVKYLWIVIAATLLASCQSGGASSGGGSPDVPTDKARDAAQRDRKVNDVQEQMRDIQH